MSEKSSCSPQGSPVLDEDSMTKLCFGIHNSFRQLSEDLGGRANLDGLIRKVEQLVSHLHSLAEKRDQDEEKIQLLQEQVGKSCVHIFTLQQEQRSLRDERDQHLEQIDADWKERFSSLSTELGSKIQDNRLLTVLLEEAKEEVDHLREDNELQMVMLVQENEDALTEKNATIELLVSNVKDLEEREKYLMGMNEELERRVKEEETLLAPSAVKKLSGDVSDNMYSGSFSGSDDGWLNRRASLRRTSDTQELQILNERLRNCMAALAAMEEKYEILAFGNSESVTPVVPRARERLASSSMWVPQNELAELDVLNKPWPPPKSLQLTPPSKKNSFMDFDTVAPMASLSAQLKETVGVGGRSDDDVEASLPDLKLNENTDDLMAPVTAVETVKLSRFQRMLRIAREIAIFPFRMVARAGTSIWNFCKTIGSCMLNFFGGLATEVNHTICRSSPSKTSFCTEE